MARTIAQIKEKMLEAKASESSLDTVNSTSKVAEWNLWMDVVAFCIYSLEQLFDFFKSDVDATIAAMKPHTLQWYVTKAKDFQLGVDLPDDSDTYALVPPADESIMIIKSAAAVELPGLNMVRIKVAKSTGGVLEAISEGEMDAFTEYMRRIKDAGVRLDVNSTDPDDFQLSIKIYYDPLVIDADGARLDGTDDVPVKNAINKFLEEMPFNGWFVLNELIDAVEAVEGVEIAYVDEAAVEYGLSVYETITVKYQPDAGYMRLNESFFDTHVEYIPNGAA